MFGRKRDDEKIYARLEIVSGVDVPGTVDMNRSEWTLGRVRDSNDTVLEVPNVSGNHCKIIFDDSESCFYIVDLNSSNGTFVNGERLEAGQEYRLDGLCEITLARKSPIVIHFRPLVTSRDTQTVLELEDDAQIEDKTTLAVNRDELLAKPDTSEVRQEEMKSTTPGMDLPSGRSTSREKRSTDRDYDFDEFTSFIE